MSKPAGIEINGVFAAPTSAIELPVNANYSWEETVRNLPPENVDAVRPFTHTSQASIISKGAHFDNVNVSVVEVGSAQSRSPDLITTTKEEQDESVGEAPEIQSTGLEWAAAELASPTKFKSSWRHSSLPYRSTTPSQAGFDQPAEKPTTRGRSNTTAVLDPRVLAVQFGDFPVAVQATAESASVANPGPSLGNSHSFEQPSSTYHAQAAEPNHAPMFASNFPMPATFSSTPVAAHMHTNQPHHATSMFMPAPYPPPGFFVPGSFQQAGFQNHLSVPYGVAMLPGFSYPSHPTALNGSEYISTRTHPTSDSDDYSPSTHTDMRVPSENQYAVDHISQSEREYDGSASGRSRTDESFESSSDNNQDRGQLINSQGPTTIAGYTCSCCHKGYYPCVQRPLYFCAGCGPTCAIRYCSAACLLADAYHHTHHCSRTFSIFFDWVQVFFFAPYY